jgi:ubiquinone/menaquinone biosynthesis C-methylase UbiE
MEAMDELPDGNFDIIYSIYALGWTVNLTQTLSNIYRCLKENGEFILVGSTLFRVD